MLGDIPISLSVDTGKKVLPYINPDEQANLMGNLLSRGFVEQSNRFDNDLRQLLSLAHGVVRANQIIMMAIPLNGQIALVSRNLVLLNETAEPLRNDILLLIDELTDRILRRSREFLGEAAVLAWASMLNDSGRLNAKAQLTAASAALNYALWFVNNPASPLIVAAFPIVYSELRTERDTPNLLSFFFNDWDRCKTVRRELVEAFMSSSWPPADLMLTASKSGDLTRILNRLIRERGGDAYLHAIEHDLDRFPESVGMKLRNELDTFKVNWDYRSAWDI